MTVLDANKAELTFVLATKVLVFKLDDFKVPLTSNLYAGAVVFIPTFPPVVYILPNVLLEANAINDLLKVTVVDVMLVFTKLLALIPVLTSPLPTFKSPDKYKLPPV